MKFKMIIALVSSVLLATSVFAHTDKASKSNETTGQYIKASTITADVKARLLADTDVSSLHITVKTVKDKVVLSGYVDTDAQKLKAEEDAKAVNGVKTVQNKLMIRAEKTTTSKK